MTGVFSPIAGVPTGVIPPGVIIDGVMPAPLGVKADGVVPPAICVLDGVAAAATGVAADGVKSHLDRRFDSLGVSSICKEFNSVTGKRSKCKRKEDLK